MVGFETLYVCTRTLKKKSKMIVLKTIYRPRLTCVISKRKKQKKS